MGYKMGILARNGLIINSFDLAIELTFVGLGKFFQCEKNDLKRTVNDRKSAFLVFSAVRHSRKRRIQNAVKHLRWRYFQK